MQIGDWNIVHGHKGWFVFSLSSRRNSTYMKVSSYPIPKYRWANVLYPWMVWKSIKAVKEIAREGGICLNRPL